ncbi:MAG: hypothetical protein ACK52I_10725 [Pseudomonadota bacterium]
MASLFKSNGRHESSQLVQFNDSVVELRMQIRSLEKLVRNESDRANDGSTDIDFVQRQQLLCDALTAELSELEKSPPPAQATAHTLYDTGNEDMRVAFGGTFERQARLLHADSFEFSLVQRPLNLESEAVETNLLRRLRIRRIRSHGECL